MGHPPNPQPLQRTPEAFSTVVVCEGRRLRGPMVAFKRRTLNGVSVGRFKEVICETSEADRTSAINCRIWLGAQEGFT